MGSTVPCLGRTTIAVLSVSRLKKTAVCWYTVLSSCYLTWEANSLMVTKLASEPKGTTMPV